ncbi:uncharacterized protein LOC111375593 isoform X4 [Olea europaea var. sylvestris]|uniref:uncharacterized protein LOC111375593 isoform X4 n=1 Tax=Olea europaea var. sylvestris TaxID=158386 RepID=UPI000C1D4552|nr:uncharacterized protein LOC111375593 isoform X4 [Olea europaea var. sylvestris]
MYAAYFAEDIIESRIIKRFRTESAGHEDGSTEKNLIRSDVVQNEFSSISTRSGLEIVGVGGIEKPCTFQTINGIEQLARTRQFKRLATCGTKIVIISLMGASETMEKLRTRGIDTSLFVGAITIERFDFFSLKVMVHMHLHCQDSSIKVFYFF